MLDKLGQLKDLWKLKGQMDEMRKRLEAMVIKTDSPRHVVTLTFNGAMALTDVEVHANAKECSEKELAAEIKDAFNKGMRECQVMAAQVMGNNFGIPNA